MKNFAVNPTSAGDVPADNERSHQNQHSVKSEVIHTAAPRMEDGAALAFAPKAFGARGRATNAPEPAGGPRNGAPVALGHKPEACATETGHVLEDWERRARALGISINTVMEACATGNGDGAHGPASAGPSSVAVLLRRVEPTAGRVRRPTSKPRALNPTRFLCRSEVREFMLDFARRYRTHSYTRVSEETLIEVNEAVRQLMIARVRRLPSKGKTI